MPASREPLVPQGLGPESVAWRVHASPVTLAWRLVFAASAALVTPWLALYGRE